MTRKNRFAAASGIVLVLGLLAVPAATAGTLYFSQDSNSTGLYTLDTGTGAASLCGAGITTVTASTAGLAPGRNPGTGCSGDLYGSKPFGLLEIQGDGSGAVTTGSRGIEGMAYDAVNDVLYGSINGSFFTINRATGDILASLPSPGNDVESLAWDRSGGIFGLADGGNLSFFDIGLNAWSLVGNVGFDSDNSGLAYAPDMQVLFAVSRFDSNLYSINPLTAASSLIGDTGLTSVGGGLAYVEDGTPRIPLPVPAVLLATGLGGLAALRHAGRRA